MPTSWILVAVFITAGNGEPQARRLSGPLTESHCEIAAKNYRGGESFRDRSGVICIPEAYLWRQR